MVKQSGSQKTSIQLYYVYAHADGIFSHELEKHLANLRRQGIIAEWHCQEITPATDGAYIFDEHLATAQIILLLVSPDFLALDFCYGVQMRRAIERHDSGDAIVIPVILRPAYWTDAPFGDLPSFPDNEEPITVWANQDEAYVNIIEGIQDAIARLLYSQSDRNRQKLSYEQTKTLLSEHASAHPIKLFYVYSSEDQNLRNQLEKHLAILQRQGFIDALTSRDILLESTREDEVDPSLNTAQIILVLISPDFLASEYAYSAQMRRVLERHQVGEATVIPVILRPSLWKDTPFENLPALPTEGKPVTSWSNTDAAFLSIVQGIRKVISSSFLPTSQEQVEQKPISAETLKDISVASGSIKIYYSYAHEDEFLLERLQIHLKSLQRLANIDDFSDRSIRAGTEWASAIREGLNTAHIILLLVSPDYLASNYCYTVEMPLALERQRAGEAVVIPVILRPVDWTASPIGRMQPLPTEGRPVTSWDNLDEAFFDIAQGIRQVVLPLISRLHQETKEQFILEGKAYYDANDYEAALAAYERALNLDPKDESVSSIIGRILLKLGRYEEALTVYDELLRMSTFTSASVYLFKGIALQQLGRLTDALGAYQKAREHGFSG